jgi:hypothetical protein
MSLIRARHGLTVSCASLTRLSFRLGPAAAVLAWQAVTKATQLHCSAVASDTCWSLGGAPPEQRSPTAHPRKDTSSISNETEIAQVQVYWDHKSQVCADAGGMKAN